jgi:hypothetical protein
LEFKNKNKKKYLSDVAMPLAHTLSLDQPWFYGVDIKLNIKAPLHWKDFKRGNNKSRMRRTTLNRETIHIPIVT